MVRLDSTTGLRKNSASVNSARGDARQPSLRRTQKEQSSQPDVHLTSNHDEGKKGKRLVNKYVL
mgnify:CR=1 FL=1